MSERTLTKWQEEYLANAHSFYERLEEQGVNTSAIKVKREPELLPILYDIKPNRKEHR